MARFWMVVVIVVAGVAGIWGLLMLGRTGPRAGGQGPARLVVVSSVPALELAAQRLLADGGEYRTLLPAGFDPVGYRPDAKALEAFKGAQLLIVTGNDLDAWAVEGARQVGRGDIPVIRMSDVMVYGMPVGGPTTRPAPGTTRTEDVLGRPFVKPPEPYTAVNTPAVEGRELLWLDTLYTQLFINELSVRLQSLRDPAQHRHIRDRAMLLGNTLISLHGAFAYRFGRLGNKKLCATDNVLAPLARRYGLTIELIPCAGTGETGYTHGPPTGLVDQADKRPVFAVLGPGVDPVAFKAAFGVRKVVLIDPMTDSTDVAKPDFEVLCKHLLDVVYASQVEAVGVR